VYLGNVMWLRGESSQAEEEFRRAIDLSPLWSVPYWLLGTLLEARGEREVARTWFEVATVHDPEDPNAAYHLARCFFVLGRQTDATMWLDRTLELSPTHRRALELRARISKGRR
jgi:tetratricopeptide (TPR) repeat protein